MEGKVSRHDEEHGEEKPAAVNNAGAYQPAAVAKEYRRKRPAKGGSKGSQLAEDDHQDYPSSRREVPVFDVIKG
jgi:hypothetical protein